MLHRLLVLSLVLLGACARGGAPVVIGAAGPWQEGYGEMTRRGIELALEEINRAGGVDGDSVLVELQDDRADGAAAAAIADRFVADARMLAVVGHVNSGTMIAASRVYDRGLPAVATTATTPDLTGISPWVFRMISSDSANGAALARFAATVPIAREAARRRAAILYVNDAYGRGLVEAFAKSFAGEIVSSDPIEDSGDQDFEPFIATYERTRPDIVFVATTEPAGIALMRQARARGFSTVFLGGDGWAGIAADAAAEGAYVGAPFSAADPRPEAQAFVRAFAAKYGATPDANAALAYDATRLVVQAVREAGRDRRAIREWLAALRGGRGFAGVSGAVRFGADGDPEAKGFVMTRVRGGELAVVEGSR